MKKFAATYSSSREGNFTGFAAFRHLFLYKNALPATYSSMKLRDMPPIPLA
ncbi:MAG: hypothetical protein ACOYMG_15030 [Candidatus Methylumidiphilus sp.]